MPAITIICTRTNGIYRAGVFHPAGAKEWPDGSFTADQMASIRKEPLLVVQEFPGAPESTTIDTAEAAEAAALDILRPFLKTPEEEARTAISELLHGGPAELPPVVEPVVDWPLHPAAAAAPPPDGAEETTRRHRRPRGGQ